MKPWYLSIYLRSLNNIIGYHTHLLCCRDQGTILDHNETPSNADGLRPVLTSSELTFRGLHLTSNRDTVQYTVLSDKDPASLQSYFICGVFQVAVYDQR